jgi:hypothetical protein
MVVYFRGKGGAVWNRSDCVVSVVAGDSPATTSTLVASRLCLGQGLAAWVWGHDQPAGALHGCAVVGIDRAAKEARLIGGAVDASVRPGELVPAAHFDKPLQERICHGCFWVPSM